MAVSTIDPNGLNIGQIGGTRNKIINGAMQVAQRGTTNSPSSAGYYTVDRMRVSGGGSVFTAIAPFTAQSTVAPEGFINSFFWSNTNAATLTTTDVAVVEHRIEGQNIADLDWGTSAAKTVTLSFWVRSSLTGDFGGSLMNSATDRAYPFTYSISAADTWEYKTVTVAGDTTGTWLTDSGIGIRVSFAMGSGPDRLGSAGAWAGAAYYGATGQVQLSETAGAEWRVTGLQLEVGDTATPFEHRSYGQELALCERYYTTLTAVTLRNTVANYYVLSDVSHTTTMRAPPTVTYSFATSGSAVADNDSASASSRVKTIRFQCRFTTVTTTGSATFSDVTADAEL